MFCKVKIQLAFQNSGDHFIARLHYQEIFHQLVRILKLWNSNHIKQYLLWRFFFKILGFCWPSFLYPATPRLPKSWNNGKIRVLHNSPLLDSRVPTCASYPAIKPDQAGRQIIDYVIAWSDSQGEAICFLISF